MSSCKDCGKPTTRAKYERCSPCSRKHQAKVTARPPQKCVICGKPVSRFARLNTGKCYPCSKSKTGVQISVDGNHAEVAGTTEQPITSLEQLVTKFKIDTSIWHIKSWKANTWEMFGKPQHQVNASMVRKHEVLDAKAEIESLRQQALEDWPTLRAPALSKRPPSPVMAQVNIFDLHVGKLAWAPETGYENYDAKIAEELFMDAYQTLLARIRPYDASRLILVLGNDGLHSDTKQGTTTSGTVLDTDSRYFRNFEIWRRLAVKAIQLGRQEFPLVETPMVPGNHDALSTWHLGHSLQAFFKDCDGVKVDNAPKQRKYVQHGQTMLMFTHGNKGKLTDYPLIMATEEPEMWGRTRFREAHTGDKHHTKTIELHGVRVRICPALCPPDAWHSENQFVGAQRSAEAYVWDFEQGMVGSATYTVPKGK